MTTRATTEIPPTPVAVVEELIRGYVARRPLALDTIRGICRYWLPSQREWLVREAVGRLVERGEAQVWSQPNGVDHVRATRALA